MDYFRSPRWEALRSHQVTDRDFNYNYHGGPRRAARCLRPAECLARYHPQCDHQEMHSPPRDLASVSRNSTAFVRLQLLLCGPCPSHRLLVEHTRCNWYWIPAFPFNRLPPYVSDHSVRFTNRAKSLHPGHPLQENYWIHVELFPETASEYSTLALNELHIVLRHPCEGETNDCLLTD